MSFYKKVSYKMLLGSIIAGVIYGFLGEFIFKMLRDVVPSIVLTMVYFLGLFLFVGLALYLISNVVYSQYKYPSYKKLWIISLILILCASALFEFLYDLISDRKREQPSDSFLFVVDISGSMCQNDPEGIRYSAIEKLIADKDDDFVYGVYSFSNDLDVVREMSPKSNDSKFALAEDSGGTEMRHALQQIITETELGNNLVTSRTRVILLSDGDPTDVTFSSSLMKVLNRYVDKDIKVSTIGLNYVKETYLRMIADKTGGVYVYCDNVDNLLTALESASYSDNVYRNLLDYRNGSFLNGLLAIMRIIFVAALGIIMAIEKSAICEKFKDTRNVFISSAICGILAGLCIEIGMNVIGVSPMIMRILTSVLMAVTFLMEDGLLNNGRDSLVRNERKDGWA